jgi:hypothetical protein
VSYYLPVYACIMDSFTNKNRDFLHSFFVTEIPYLESFQYDVYLLYHIYVLKNNIFYFFFINLKCIQDRDFMQITEAVETPG